MNQKVEPEIAHIEALAPASIQIVSDSFDFDDRRILFLTFVLDGNAYFFHSERVRQISKSSVEVALPEAIYRSERRSRVRESSKQTERVALEREGDSIGFAYLVDKSPEGLAVDVPNGLESSFRPGQPLRVSLQDRGLNLHAEVRGLRESERPGWVRIGLRTSPKPRNPLASSTMLSVDDESLPERLRTRISIAIGGARIVADRARKKLRYAIPDPPGRPVDILDSERRHIRAIVDSWGQQQGSIAVIVPPAWGRTKETLLPLAATITASFRRIDQPVTVVRFDGINRRGDSHKDPGCDLPGSEQHRFTFSQGVQDIRAIVDHLYSRPEGRPARTILVSFSAASIEARRAVALDSRIDGWVCVVGSADLQSMMKSISGGIDYALGAERGVQFGIQEIMGVEVDMDFAATDALSNQLAYLSDADDDFARIRVPVVWVAGDHDAWMDQDRVREAMSCGDTSLRRFIRVPTGHALRSSMEALHVFRMIAREVARIGLNRSIRGAVPDLALLERQRNAERSRRRSSAPDVRAFWKDYLLGKNRSVGIELMTATSAYRAFMEGQINRLRLTSGCRVLDLGSGTGAFPRQLAGSGGTGGGVEIVELDFVSDALRRTRERLGSIVDTSFVAADLEIVQRTARLPFLDSSYDAVLASLVLGYVSDPEALLREIRRILKPGGRIVASSLRRDADMSKLYVDGASEIRTRWKDYFGRITQEEDCDQAVRAYLNEASRLLDLEEMGRFTFWDVEELQELVRKAGFVSTDSLRSFGDPPQAGIVYGESPSAGRSRLRQLAAS